MDSDAVALLVAVVDEPMLFKIQYLVDGCLF